MSVVKRAFVRFGLLGFLVWFTVCVLLYCLSSETATTRLSSSARAEQPVVGAWLASAPGRFAIIGESPNDNGPQLRPTTGASISSVAKVLVNLSTNRSTHLNHELALRHEVPVIQEGPSTPEHSTSAESEGKPTPSRTLGTVSLVSLATATPGVATACGRWVLNRTIGFTLSLSYWDQQTWSCGNILGFQHWASRIGMVVVEPFMVKTKFQMPSRKIVSSDLPMSKLYDMDFWNDYSLKQGYAPIVTWECFLEKAPRQLILVYLRRSANRCIQNELRSNTEMLVAYGFQVVREHCIAAPLRHPLTPLEFNRQVLGNYSAHNVTVVFQEWSQYTAGDNLEMPESHLPIALMRYLPIRATREVLDDVDTYIRRHLASSFVAILLRVEWLVMNVGNARHTTLHSCVNKTLQYLAAAKEKVHTKSVFVGMDVGKYGSTTFNLDQFNQYIEEDFLNVIYPESNMTISQWEHTFEEVSHSKVPGYIALLQKEVATQGACLLLIGQGSFQRQALRLYQERHSKSEMCYLKTTSRCEVEKIVGFTVQ